MIYKTTSVKRVIAKVFSDLELKEGDHRISDMVEWAGEALEKIGAFPSFINKVTGKDNTPIINFTNYQARLPHDFHRLVQVAYSSTENGPFYPMRYATGSLEVASQSNIDITTNPASSAYPNIVADSTLITLIMDLYSYTYEQALSLLNTNSSLRDTLQGLLNSVSTAGKGDTNTMDYVYVIHDNYIKTNVASGCLMIAYQAIPTDIDGYPLIPDDISFIEALYWYIVMKLYYPQWKEGRIRDEVYYDARRSWNYYCKQAYGNAMIPNGDQLESIKNSWLRLVPEINEHASFFSTLGEEQRIYNANR